jgi:2-hydroxy-3-oxopropionate reductase
MSEPIGLVGLGLMGSALAKRLLAAGFSVVGFDVDKSKIEALQTLGGSGAASLAELSRQCRRIFVAVLNIDQVDDVVEQLWQSASAATEAHVVFCVATCPPSRVAALAERAATHGLVLLDTPVSGTSRQVADGSGLGLIAGDRQQIEANADAISAIYPRSCFIGPAGDGSKAKLAINLILGLHRLALAEGLVLAERFGLDLPTFLDVARSSAAYSQVMDVKGNKMVSGEFSPQGKITQNLKDFAIILDEATQRHQELPAARVLFDVLEASTRHGDGELDNCAIIEEVRRRGAV